MRKQRLQKIFVTDKKREREKERVRKRETETKTDRQTEKDRQIERAWNINNQEKEINRRHSYR